ncbi:Uncharacterised protein [Cedecea neteri]|uniref:Uncharacterized protein n=1 Tax=Cedecea neteri TaxID=158822 RepID=A0A2X2T4B9_9ENTR|nr:Uncharacterised protein [Cedecea neteri]
MVRLCFGQRFFEEDRYFDLYIVASRGVRLARLPGLLAEHRREDIFEVLGVVALFAALVELLVKLRVVAVLPHLVVFGAALLVAQHFPGFRYFFKAGFCVGLFADVGVILRARRR